MIEAALHKEQLIDTGQICPYCENPSTYIDSAQFYGGTSYGNVYACIPCRAWVGVHKGTDVSLGRLADSDLRKWRKNAHFHFDMIWKMKRSMGMNQTVARKRAYQQLSEFMNLPAGKTHIGMFNVDQCKEVVELCETKEWITQIDLDIIFKQKNNDSIWSRI